MDDTRVSVWLVTAVHHSVTWKLLRWVRGALLARVGRAARWMAGMWSASVTGRVLGALVRVLVARPWRVCERAGEVLRVAAAHSVAARLTEPPADPDQALHQVLEGSVVVGWHRRRARAIAARWQAWRRGSLVFGEAAEGSPGFLYRLGWVLLIGVVGNVALVLATDATVSVWGVYGRVVLLLVGLLFLGWKGDAMLLVERSVTWRLLQGTRRHQRSDAESSLPAA